MDDSKTVDKKRRGFLRAAGGAGALGALAVVVASDAPAAAPVAAKPPAPDAKPVGYHETEHIRQYYRTAKYW